MRRGEERRSSSHPPLTEPVCPKAYSDLQRGSFYKAKAAGDYQLAADNSDVPYLTAKI